MPEAVIPAGATIAVFIMTVISWYGMLRTGVQLIYNEIEDRKSIAPDIRNMFTDLEHHQNKLNDWRRSWCICDKTPNDVLLLYWSEPRLKIIEEKVSLIKADFLRTRKKLKRFAKLEEREWKSIKKPRRELMAFEFIWWKKNFVQKLIDRFPSNMEAIRHEADTGWKQQQLRLSREIAYMKPYHALTSYLLVRIAKQSQSDAEALSGCIHAVRDEFTILLDLDIFDVVAAVSEEKDTPQIGEMFEAGHLKVDLLLREANQPDTELVRVKVERSSDNVTPASRIVDAFRAVLGVDGRSTQFSGGAATMFDLSKTHRAGEPCSKLRQTFHDILARQDPPTYDNSKERFIDRVLVLGELSTCRAAFELAQACLLFLRTTWFSEVCRCGIRCEPLPESAYQKWYQFGLEMAPPTHQKPLWRFPYASSLPIEGKLEDSWCARTYPWDALNKPLRHLGLLLVELALGTIVVPETPDGAGRAAEVVAIQILIKAQHESYEWKRLNLTSVQNLVKQTFHDSDRFADAVEYCLTGSFPPSPTDTEWEKHLKRFYFRVVKPLRDIYDIKLSSGCLG